MSKLHAYEYKKFVFNRKIAVNLGEYGEIVIVIRGNSAKDLREFAVVLTTKHQGKRHIAIQHCWMSGHREFHTHVFASFQRKGRRRYKRIVQPLEANLQAALDWSRKDMLTNWYSYLQHFYKLAKVHNRRRKYDQK